MLLAGMVSGETIIKFVWNDKYKDTEDLSNCDVKYVTVVWKDFQFFFKVIFESLFADFKISIVYLYPLTGASEKSAFTKRTVVP